MHIKDSIRDDMGVIGLQGSLLGDKDAAMLLEVVHAHLHAGRRNILLDLSSLEFVNSIGLGTLFSIRSSVSKSRGKLMLANLGGKVMELLVLTKADRVFSLSGSVDEGIKALNTPQ